ncbi:sulfatase family protein [Mycobacterium kansasii 732]|nr:sulfatase family protein [Mycobacterium kansasii 732]
MPPDTELTQRPSLFPAWDSLSDSQKKLYARQMEVFAGFSENADWNVGRLLDGVEDLGELDNTLVFYIWGDNGASMEGTITGSFNEMTFLNGLVLDADHQLRLIEQYGGLEALGDEHTAPHFASAWAHANNTPFQWGKQMARHLGGARDPMVVAWPGRIKPDKRIRDQFTHCIDITPTVLEAVGLPEPTSVDGIDQEPMDGTSFLHTFDDAAADERHSMQYFEMFGSRAIYQDGWWACTRLDKAPWTSPRKPCNASRPEATTPTTTSGSCTTCPTTSRRPTTSPRSIPTRSPNSPGCGGGKPNATGCCRCWAAWRWSSASCRRCPPSRGSRTRATCTTFSAA